MSLNILITGSSGFLGSKLCELLGDRDHRVTAIDIAPPSKKFSSIKYVVSAIEDYLNTNINILKTFDLVIHTASVLPYKGNKDLLIETNIKTTRYLISKVAEIEDLFFIYISSSGVYGKPHNLPVTRSTKFNALDLYAETKVVSEETIRNTLNKNFYSIIRPRTILGINRKGIFEVFFKLIKYRVPIPLPNNGNQKIQFVDVEDLARLILHIGFNNINGEWPAAAPNPKPLKDHLQTLGVNINKKVFKLNINPKLFEMIGIFLVKIKIVKFTKWHFGSFPYDFYFDEKWKPENFEYKFDNEETFLKSANTFFTLRNT